MFKLNTEYIFDKQLNEMKYDELNEKYFRIHVYEYLPRIFVSNLLYQDRQPKYISKFQKKHDGDVKRRPLTPSPFLAPWPWNMGLTLYGDIRARALVVALDIAFFPIEGKMGRNPQWEGNPSLNGKGQARAHILTYLPSMRRVKHVLISSHTLTFDNHFFHAKSWLLCCIISAPTLSTITLLHLCLLVGKGATPLTLPRS